MVNFGWQGYIFISVILYSISVVLQRRILKEENSNPIAYCIFFQILTGVMIGIIGFLSSEMGLPSNLPDFFGNMILMTILYGLSSILIFKSLKETEASKFAIILSTKTFFTVFASSIFLGELLNGRQILGTLLIFVSVIVVTLKSTKLSFSKGDLMAMGAAIGFGLAVTNDRFLIQNFLLYSYLSIAFILPGLFIAALYPKDVLEIKKLLRIKSISRVGVLSFIYALSAITFFVALKSAPNSSQVASVNMTSVIVTVFLSIVFLKEKEDLAKKLLGAFICFLGLLMVG